MIKLIGPLAKTLFALFVLAVFAGVLYYSYNALSLIFPNDLMGQLFGLALFDIAALVWFLGFVKNSQSTMQYVFSMIGFLIGLLGTLVLVGVEVGLSSGLLEVDAMAKPLSYTFVGVLISHLILIYARHAAAPEIAADISIGVERAKITDNAQRQAEKLLMDNQDAIAVPLANELVRRALHDLNLQPRSGEVIDAQAFDIVAPVEQEKRNTVSDFFTKIFGKQESADREYQSSVQSVATHSQQQTPKQSPAPVDAGLQGGDESEPKA